VHSKAIGLDSIGSIQLCDHSEKGAKRVQTLSNIQCYNGWASKPPPINRLQFPRKDTKSLTGMLSTLALVIQVTKQKSFSETIGYAIGISVMRLADGFEPKSY
jgi:hypothetical protein